MTGAEPDTRHMRQIIGQFLESPDWTPGEKFVIKWQFSLLGDFYSALAKAIARADEENLSRLGMGFPDEVEGFLDWSRGSLAGRLRLAGLPL